MKMIKQFRNKYKWLSNFTECKILLDSKEYKSVEHAYMSAKSDSAEWKDYCQKEKSPGKIKKKSKTIKLIENWNNIKLLIMEQCIEQKFNQEPFRTLLIETGDIYIQEGNYWGDTFWGYCLKTERGENHLGIIIMKKREKLINNYTQEIKNGS